MTPKRSVPARFGSFSSPFASVDEAWFWTVAALTARHDGSRHGGARAPRPCDPDDVVRCLDRLYRDRRIELAHARVLRTWGERQISPGGTGKEAADMMLWRQAMDRLRPVLRQKGIVQ
jgi:hypothetical protein